MNCLILGSNGYIGSRLYQHLSSIHNVVGVDINWFTPKVNSIDYNTIEKHYIDKFDIIILLAAHSSVKMCDGPIQSSWKNNVTNFINLINKCNSNQLILYASSGSVYSAQNTCNSFIPVNYYDLTKYVLDLHAEKYTRKLNIIGLRFGTVNGFSPNLRKELMINSMVESALQKKFIEINNVSINRPILGISDLVRSIEHMLLKPIPGIYNLCSFNTTVQSIANDVAKELNVEIKNLPDTSTYDFKFSNTEFCNIFNFEFLDNTTTITRELLSNQAQIKNDRNSFIFYE